MIGLLWILTIGIFKVIPLSSDFELLELVDLTYYLSFFGSIFEADGETILIIYILGFT